MSPYADYYRAEAAAHRAQAQAYAAMAAAARLNPDRTPEQRAGNVAHYERMAAEHADMAARYEADALGEAA